MSQLELSEASGISRQVIGRLVNADEMTPATAKAISAVVGLDLLDIAQSFRGANEPHQQNPLLAKRLPPAAYAFVYERIGQLERGGLSVDQLLVAEQLFLNDTFATLNAKKRDPMSEDDWMKKVRADWRAIEAYMAEDAQEEG